MTTPTTPTTAQSSQKIDFPIWTTLLIGQKHILSYIRHAGRISGDAGHFLFYGGFKQTAQEESCIDLVKVTPQELGFETSSVSNALFYERALELGLELCPEEVGPQLRIDLRRQAWGEQINVGMKPFSAGTCEGMKVFCVERHKVNGALWLSTSDPNPSSCNRDTPWVFVKPRK